MTVIVFAAIGAAVFAFVGWLLVPPAPPPQELSIRIAANDEIVLVGIKLGDDVTFLQLDR